MEIMTKEDVMKEMERLSNQPDYGIEQDSIIKYLKEKFETDKIVKAIKFATKKHKRQKRSDGKDYITHPLKVYEILKLVTDNEDILVSSILHDTIEDTDTTEEEIKTIFGNDVLNLVLEVTKWSTNECKYDVQTREGLMIKLADMLHNVSENDPSLLKKIKLIRSIGKDG